LRQRGRVREDRHSPVWHPQANDPWRLHTPAVRRASRLTSIQPIRNAIGRSSRRRRVIHTDHGACLNAGTGTRKACSPHAGEDPPNLAGDPQRRDHSVTQGRQQEFVLRGRIRAGGLCSVAGRSVAIGVWFSVIIRTSARIWPCQCGAESSAQAGSLPGSLPHSALESGYGICQFREGRFESFAPLPGRHDLWVEALAGVGAGRGGRPSVHPPRAGAGHQLFRHRRYVFVGRQRRDSGPGAL
jgi:hypothetical protein